jgi:hypothetical protein
MGSCRGHALKCCSYTTTNAMKAWSSCRIPFFSPDRRSPRFQARTVHERADQKASRCRKPARQPCCCCAPRWPSRWSCTPSLARAAVWSSSTSSMRMSRTFRLSTPCTLAALSGKASGSCMLRICFHRFLAPYRYCYDLVPLLRVGREKTEEAVFNNRAASS